uniref:Methyltransferase-like protein 9 n=1 Tax=Steinernema glaseri TaxID=37863 RepID=A0A1I7YX74_9BILA
MYRGQRMANMLMDKERSDIELLTADRSAWYSIQSDMLSAEVASKFYMSFFDTASEQFLGYSTAVSNSLCLQMYYALASTFLSIFMTKTNINGFLNRGGMFLFSREQMKDFLDIPDDWIKADKMILDLGAGDGGVTSVLNEFYAKVHVTEMSKVMQWRLQQKGFTVIPADTWANTHHKYNLVTALNLLDRHFNPSLLLSELHKKTTESNCLLMIAVVLPVRQYVEFNPSSRSTRADSAIGVKGRTFEEHANSLVKDVFEPAGFELVRWTRVPYLCEGDINRAFYKLDDAVFLLRPVGNPPSVSTTQQTFSNVPTEEL